MVVMFPKTSPSEYLGFHRQTAALLVREPQTSRAKLFPQGPVLFLEIIDNLALVLVHPTGDCDEYELQRKRRQRDHNTQATKSVAWRSMQGPRRCHTGTRSWRRSGFWTERGCFIAIGLGIRLDS